MTDGGGLFSQVNSSPTLTNVTFSGNTALGNGGGMYNFQNSPQIRDTLFWGNTAGGSGAQIYNGSDGNPSLNDSVIQDGCPTGSTCTNILISDPLLGTLGNYGGFTQTIPLLAGSSAIDTGINETCAQSDQRGVVRPQGLHCDISAFEFTQFTITGNAGIVGAILTYDGGLAIAGGFGDYSIPVNSDWIGTITPFMPGYSFSPTEITITTPVTFNLTGQDFTAHLYYTIFLPLVIR